MAMGVGMLFLLSMGTASLSNFALRLAELDLAGFGVVLEGIGRVSLQFMSFVLMLCIFLMVYKFLPNTKTYWRYVWPGAIVAAVLFELAKNLFLVYLSRFASYDSVYGSLAPVIAMLFWAFVSALILILGAELSSEYGRMRRGRERGQLLHPLEENSKQKATRAE